eukprot:CAMPEP_0197046360 /NCGR_PEP_ID=MMETSP1384-20130603/22085_1 /TAXON_ID=29189 /ORGANISM="Ammonia sp." /LENGTH=70 /DNA_ID=CAMNT_0042478131 /DNA_START=257 /DNA_END=469 /DNA_ORIENTATION=-
MSFQRGFARKTLFFALLAAQQTLERMRELAIFGVRHAMRVQVGFLMEGLEAERTFMARRLHQVRLADMAH